MMMMMVIMTRMIMIGKGMHIVQCTIYSMFTVYTFVLQYVYYVYHSEYTKYITQQCIVYMYIPTIIHFTVQHQSASTTCTHEPQTFMLRVHGACSAAVGWLDFLRFTSFGHQQSCCAFLCGPKRLLYKYFLIQDQKGLCVSLWSRKSIKKFKN